MISNPENIVVSVAGNVADKELLETKIGLMFNSTNNQKFD